MSKKIIKTILGFAAAAIIAAGGYFTNAYTTTEAIAVITDTNKSIAACTLLLNGEGFTTTNEGE